MPLRHGIIISAEQRSAPAPAADASHTIPRGGWIFVPSINRLWFEVTPPSPTTFHFGGSQTKSL